MGYPVKTTVINTFKDPISRLVWFLVVVLLFALGAYWWWRLNEHNNQLSYAESQLQLRAEQTSNALASQAGILISNIDYLSNNLAELYVAGDSGLFHAAASEVFNVYEKTRLFKSPWPTKKGTLSSASWLRSTFPRMNPNLCLLPSASIF